MYPRQALDFQSSDLSFLTSSVTGLCHHIQPFLDSLISYAFASFELWWYKPVYLFIDVLRIGLGASHAGSASFLPLSQSQALSSPEALESFQSVYAFVHNGSQYQPPPLFLIFKFFRFLFCEDFLLPGNLSVSSI